LLTGQPRNADVIALGFCKLLALSSRDLQPLLQRDEQVRQRIESVAAERLNPSPAPRPAPAVTAKAGEPASQS
jgi:CPA1 family monovalent cation:H+ antiporter